ncbi:MAG: hypothetical protein IK092_01210 [Muribaculaceae bacterium]|nr:hypothetical protein [Muribaculaceae bacterium]
MTHNNTTIIMLGAVTTLCLVLFSSVVCQAQETSTRHHSQRANRTLVTLNDSIVDEEAEIHFAADSIALPEGNQTGIKVFNPDPMRAVWLSALCPGLGQVYNRRYWKIPIVVGAFVGLGYGTSWNNRMLNDYTKAYHDIMDNDPTTRSYMDFFPPTVSESSLDKEWLKRTFKTKKDYYRRYRDLCIIGIVGLYLVNIVDAYVDASLAHFDVSPDLALDVKPTLLQLPSNRLQAPSPGLRCAISF